MKYEIRRFLSHIFCFSFHISQTGVAQLVEQRSPKP